MKGFFNRILYVDLSNQKVEINTVDKSVYENFLGGKGLATWLLTELNPPGVDPLSPENRLIFATGAVTGTATWGSSRYGVFTKSPLTGLYAESYSGGKVPEAIAAAGFDAIVIHGRADGPTLMEITPEGAVFHDAGHLAGKDTFETESAVKAEFSNKYPKGWKTGISVIGPAAEAGVKFSIIKNDGWRCAGRAGTRDGHGLKKHQGHYFCRQHKTRSV